MTTKEFKSNEVSPVELDRYQRDLEEALKQSRADLAEGRVVQESPQDHLARLDALDT